MIHTKYYYFTEQPYTGYDPTLQEQYPALRLTLPNSHYDPKLASDLYNRYHDEYQVADEVGFDGIMINEHHTAPFCMQASINITGRCLPRSPGGPRSSCWAIPCQWSIPHCGWPKSWR